MQQPQMHKQSQAQQQQLQQQQQAPGKMTLDRAVTLLSFRMSSVEAKLLEMGSSPQGEFNSDLMKSVLERLEELERSGSAGTSTGSNESNDSVLQMKVALLEQKVDVISKKGGAGAKNDKNDKSQIDELRNEIKQMKELMQVLQGVALENSQKILEISMSLPYPDVTEEEDEENKPGEEEEECNVV